MRLVLFDIDGTLMLTGGAGMRAFYRALKNVFDVDVDSEVIRPDGKTDPIIAREILAFYGLADSWNERSRAALFADYLKHLEEEMKRAVESATVRILPGVREILSELSSTDGLLLGLVTGNLEAGARIKLEKTGLTRYFRFGGYGSDSDDRTSLIRIGIERGVKMMAPAPMEAAFVIGDTPLDIIHGHAAGARVIAVASGRYSTAELGDYSPDLLVPALTAAGSIISFMRDHTAQQMRRPLPCRL